MNERIKELAKQCRSNPMTSAFEPVFDKEKFVESIVQECRETFSKVWYKQGIGIKGGEINKLLKEFDKELGSK